MKPERWRKVEEIFQSAIERDEQERAAFLDEACAGDDSLLREVQSLIAADEQAGSFIDVDSLVREDEESLSGKRIGPYRVTSEIGHGGMGSVYLAAREDEYRKQVAIKLIRRGMDSDFIIRRFLGERQILASLDHPNIARLLDGGTTEDGLPYFVMEYIEGKPIDRYSDENRLNTVARLRLFRDVCSAVHYAHKNLVIHRDIKPGNILVTADGAVKLLDFGIAKLLDPAAQPLDQTATAIRMMTPDYASPEQVRGLAITTASDVYSLGVVLYELLTGHKPHRFSSLTPDEIAQVVCEKEPERPSNAITREEEATTSTDALRGTLMAERVSDAREGSPEKLRRKLTGDLDNIVLMAMRKEAERRYSSAEQLSEDIRRHLVGLPVIARRDTLTYRASKFIRRHRAGVMAACIVALALVAGLAVSLWQAGVARRERARAERRFNDVRSLANSFMFEFHDEIENLSGSTRARELLVIRALEYLDSLAQESGDDPSLRRELATAYLKVGDIHDTMGDKGGALESYSKALAICQSLCEARPTDAQALRELSDSYARLSDLMGVTGDTTASLELSLKSLALDERLASENPDDPSAREILAGSYMGTAYLLGVTGDKAGEMESYRKSLAIREQIASADSAGRGALADSYRHLGVSLKWHGDLTGSLSNLRKALALDRELSTTDPANAKARRKLAISHITLGEALEDAGDNSGALENYRKSLAIREEMAATDPKSAGARGALANSLISIGRLLIKMGDISGALENSRRALLLSESLASADPANARARYYVALCLMISGQANAKRGETEAARERLIKAVTILEALVAADPKSTEFHADLAGANSDLGDLLMASSEGRSRYERSLNTYLAMQSRGVLPASLAKKPDEMERKIALCDASQAKLKAR